MTSNQGGARKAFAALTNQVPPAASLTRLGDSLVLTLPANDDAAREKWFDLMQARCTNTFVAVSNAPVTVSVTFIAPNNAVATNLTTELNDYLVAARQMFLVAPWSPEAKQADFAPRQRARQEWSTISHELAQTWRDPSLAQYATKIQAAYKRGSQAEMLRLQEEQSRRQVQLREEACARLRRGSPRRVAPGLLELHTQLASLSFTNTTERKDLLRKIAGELGEVAYDGEAPAPRAMAYGAYSGMVLRHGLFMEARWLNFRDVTQGFPAMTQWLWDQGCRQFKYEFEGTGWAGEPGAADSEEE
jgi:hypothetical protein